MVHPFPGFSEMPDQQEILDDIANRQFVRDEDQPGATALLNKLPKPSGHCAYIVRYEDASERFRESQDLRVRRLLGNHRLRSFEIDRRFPDQQAPDDLLIEIGVS